MIGMWIPSLYVFMCVYSYSCVEVIFDNNTLIGTWDERYRNAYTSKTKTGMTIGQIGWDEKR